MSQNSLAPDDIRHARVRISPYMNTIVGAPFDPSSNPQVAAQFSAQYGLASAVIRGRVGLDETSPVAACDPDVGALARRVQVEVDQNNNGLVAPATVILDTARGHFEETVLAVPGSAAAPLSDLEVRAKFTDCVAHGPRPLSPAETEQMIDRVDELPTLDDLSTFFHGIESMAKRQE